MVVWANPAAASVPGAGDSAVQLPTFSMFAVNTTVSVPDRGSASGRHQQFAGGQQSIRRALAPFGNQSFGGSRSVSGASVGVVIHDFDAMDTALLGEPASLFAAHHRPGDVLQGHTAAVLAGHWLPSVQERTRPGRPAEALAARRIALRDTRAEEAETYFARARAAEAEGKTGIARIYYQMAARRASGPLKERAWRGSKACETAPAKIAESHP